MSDLKEAEVKESKSTFKLPDMKIREVKPNKLQSQVEYVIKDLLSGLYKMDWTDKMELFGFVFYCFPECSDVKRLVFLLKINFFGFLFDDYMDRHECEWEKWINIFETRKSINDTPLELLFDIMWKDAINELTEGQQKRFLEGFSMAARSYKNVGAIKSGETLLSAEDYIAFRLNDVFHIIAWIMGEYAANITVDDVVHSDLVQKLHTTAANHGIRVNDLFSYQKELKEEGGRYNYVTIIGREHSISLNEAGVKIWGEIQNLEIQFEDVVEQIKSAGISISDAYFQQIRNILAGNLYWSSVCKRYGDYRH